LAAGLAAYIPQASGESADGAMIFVLVNKENYFVFQPMLPEVISGSIGLLNCQSDPASASSDNLHVRDVESIDIRNKTITTSPGFRPHAHTIDYDYLFWRWVT
jgi:NADH dehydrogenase